MKSDRFFARGQRLRTLGKSICRSFRHAPEGVHVWISRIEGEAARDGLDRDRVKAEVEWRLAAAGIPVVHHQEQAGKAPVAPCLGVLLHLRQADVMPSYYVFSIEVFFVQAETSKSDILPTNMHMTWCREAIGDVQKAGQEADWSAVFTRLGSLVEAFIAHYWMVNPQAKAPLLIN